VPTTTDTLSLRNNLVAAYREADWTAEAIILHEHLPSGIDPLTYRPVTHR
jgi:hypothetical protein